MAVSQKMTVTSVRPMTPASTADSLALSSNQYKAVRLSTVDATAGQATLITSSNVFDVFGILQNSPTTAQIAAVCVKGVTPFRMALSTLSAGDFVAASSLSLGVIPTSDGGQIGQIIYGSSGAVGRVVTINYLGANSSYGI